MTGTFGLAGGAAGFAGGAHALCVSGGALTGCWFRGTGGGATLGPATLRMGGALTGVSGRGGGAALHRVGVPSSGPSFSSFSLSTAMSWTDCSWSPLVPAVHDVTRSAASPTCKLAKAAWSKSGVGGRHDGSGLAATAAMPFGGAVGHRRVGLGVGLGAGDGGELGTGDVRGVCARDGGVLGTGTVCGSSSKRTLHLPRATRRGGGSAFVCCGGGGDAA